MVEVYLLTCRGMLRCVVSFLSLIQQFAEPPSFILILTFSYCFYEFIREHKLGSDRLPATDKANSFHGQTGWVRFNDCVPDFQDAMELWAHRPPAIIVKVISVCRVHVFLHQYVADLREERSENVLRTFAASPFIFDMAVSSTSGVIATPPESFRLEKLESIFCMVSTRARRSSYHRIQA